MCPEHQDALDVSRSAGARNKPEHARHAPPVARLGSGERIAKRRLYLARMGQDDVHMR